MVLQNRFNGPQDYIHTEQEKEQKIKQTEMEENEI